MEPYSAATCHSLVKGSAFRLSKRFSQHDIVVTASGRSSDHGVVGDMQRIISCLHIVFIPIALLLRATDSVSTLYNVEFLVIERKNVAIIL